MLNLPKAWILHNFYSHLCSQELSEQCLLLLSHTLLKQGLLPDIRRLSNDYFPFQQDGPPAQCSRYTVVYLHSHVPEFTEPDNWHPVVWIYILWIIQCGEHCNRWCIVSEC